jgi:hypothetical protein
MKTELEILKDLSKDFNEVCIEFTELQAQAEINKSLEDARKKMEDVAVKIAFFQGALDGTIMEFEDKKAKMK